MAEEKVKQILSAASDDMDMAVQFLDDALGFYMDHMAGCRRALCSDRRNHETGHWNRKII